MGVVGLPSRVTGLAAMSIMAEITFIPGFHGNSNSSQTACAVGFAWRLIFSKTVLLAIIYLRRVALDAFLIFCSSFGFLRVLRGKVLVLGRARSRASSSFVFHLAIPPR